MLQTFNWPESKEYLNILVPEHLPVTLEHLIQSIPVTTRYSETITAMKIYLNNCAKFASQNLRKADCSNRIIIPFEFSYYSALVFGLRLNSITILEINFENSSVVFASTYNLRSCHYFVNCIIFSILPEYF